VAYAHGSEAARAIGGRGHPGSKLLTPSRLRKVSRSGYTASFQGQGSGDGNRDCPEGQMLRKPYPTDRLIG